MRFRKKLKLVFTKSDLIRLVVKTCVTILKRRVFYICI